MEKHTPEPWVKHVQSSGDINILATGARGAPLIIAVVYGDVPYFEANARLIAAAPELLAVAQRAAEHWAGTDSSLGEAARQAVARATGQDTNQA